MSQSLTYTVPEAHAKARLDRVLLEVAPGESRTRAQQWIANGQVQVNGVVITAGGHKVRTGDVLSITLLAPTESTLQPADIPLKIMYEDDHLLVIDKQAGLTVHPSAGHHNDTLVNALLTHCGDSLSGIGGVLRPGIVHRLDRDTSGLMVVAKHDHAHRALSEQLKDRTLTRIYHAWCWGTATPLAGTVDNFLDRHPQDRTRMHIIRNPGTRRTGRRAITHYRTVETYADGALSWVECKLETGRTHQIRVHLAHLGCPIIGDKLYLVPTKRRPLADAPPETIQLLHHFPRQALHAKIIMFEHPETGETMVFESEISEKNHPELANIIETLEDIREDKFFSDLTNKSIAEGGKTYSHEEVWKE